MPATRLPTFQSPGYEELSKLFFSLEPPYSESAVRESNIYYRKIYPALSRQERRKAEWLVDLMILNPAVGLDVGANSFAYLPAGRQVQGFVCECIRTYDKSHHPVYPVDSCPTAFSRMISQLEKEELASLIYGVI